MGQFGMPGNHKTRQVGCREGKRHRISTSYITEGRRGAVKRKLIGTGGGCVCQPLGAGGPIKRALTPGLAGHGVTKAAPPRWHTRIAFKTTSFSFYRACRFKLLGGSTHYAQCSFGLRFSVPKVAWDQARGLPRGLHCGSRFAFQR